MKIGTRLLGAGLLLLGASVAGMAITMAARHDPDASPSVTAGSCLVAAGLAGVTAYVCRPMFRLPVANPRPAPVRLQESKV